MAERKKATEAAPETGNKDNTKNRIRATVRSLFRSGKRLTAKDINNLTNSNDARKVISDLRKEGCNIQDVRQANMCKLYWLIPDNKQGELSFLNEQQDDF
ncbi:hypothetical protein [Parabacteroides gordonii]|uniref:hypothetical protein n=1 Tax=Parabacteroides gordonii TaxID=574930 RepID=UPI000EE38F47|nr:hypothetical protein [Parabacteroides gordonii]RGP09539.1 hypothetical protein DXB27_23435 [Parabacteroides gordonii]